MIEPKIIMALSIARDFMDRTFKVTGGCDHSVGICECQDKADYEFICEVLNEAQTNQS